MNGLPDGIGADRFRNVIIHSRLQPRTLVDELIWNEAHNEVVFVKYLQ